MACVWVIHGPNLNLLGSREPALYGATTLADINARLVALATLGGHTLVPYQSNHEGDLVTRVQQAAGVADLLLLNPGGYTHTSVALRDALLAVGLPAIEVHLTNTHAREPFRQVSLIADVVVARVLGFGALSYEIALEGGLRWLAQANAGH